MNAAALLAPLLFAISVSATPGPNNTMLTASGATWGVRRTMPHMFGIALGFPVMLLAVGLGAGELLRSHPAVAAGLRWLGVAYLLWLALKIARAEPSLAPGQAGGRPFTFLQAALFQWVNPKAWTIAVGAVVTYAEPGKPSALLTLALVFLLVTLPITYGWTLAGVGVARLLRTTRAVRTFNLLLAGLLVLSLLPLILEE